MREDPPDDPPALDGALVRYRVDVLPGRPVPRLLSWSAPADAITFFVGSILFTLGGALQSRLAWLERARRRRPGRLVVGDRPVGRHALLQRHHLPGDARRADEPRVQHARLAAGRAGRSASSSPASSPTGRHRARRRIAAGARRRGLVAARHQPLGCFLGISAVAGYVVPSTGSTLDQAAANRNTSSGPRASSPARSLRSGPAGREGRSAAIRELEHELESELRR